MRTRGGAGGADKARAELADPRLYWRGAWIWASVRQVRGNAVRTSTRSKTEAVASLVADELEQTARGERMGPVYLSNAIEFYVRDLGRRHRAEATLGIAREKLAHFQWQWGAGCHTRKITGGLVLAYMDEREKQGAAPVTIGKELGQLRAMLRLMRFMGAFELELDRVFPPGTSARGRPVGRWPCREEVEALLVELPPRRMMWVLFILATGARLGEVRRAQWEDWAPDSIRLRGTKTAAADSGVPVTRVTRPILDRMEALDAFDYRTGTESLFYPWPNMHRELHRACKRAGIAPVSPNDLRRAFAQWHKEAGLNDELTSKLLRHTTTKLVQTTYGKLSAEQLGKLSNDQIAKQSDGLHAPSPQLLPNPEDARAPDPREEAPLPPRSGRSDGQADRPRVTIGGLSSPNLCTLGASAFGPAPGRVPKVYESPAAGVFRLNEDLMARRVQCGKEKPR